MSEVDDVTGWAREALVFSTTVVKEKKEWYRLISGQAFPVDLERYHRTWDAQTSMTAIRVENRRDGGGEPMLAVRNRRAIPLAGCHTVDAELPVGYGHVRVGDLHLRCVAQQHTDLPILANGPVLRSTVLLRDFLAAAACAYAEGRIHELDTFLCETPRWAVLSSAAMVRRHRENLFAEAKAWIPGKGIREILVLRRAPDLLHREHCLLYAPGASPREGAEKASAYRCSEKIYRFTVSGSIVGLSDALKTVSGMPAVFA